MIYGGLRLVRQSDGGMHVTIYDNAAENSPVFREVIFSEELVDWLVRELRPATKESRKPAAKKATKKVK